MDPFDDSGEQWPTILSRMSKLMTFGLDAKKVLVLHSVVGPKTYRLLHSKIAPAKPGDMKYKHIVDKLPAHFFPPKPLVTAARFRFHKRNQEDGESVVQYVAVLKRLSEHCEFGAHLEDTLRC